VVRWALVKLTPAVDQPMKRTRAWRERLEVSRLVAMSRTAALDFFRVLDAGSGDHESHTIPVVAKVSSISMLLKWADSLFVRHMVCKDGCSRCRMALDLKLCTSVREFEMWIDRNVTGHTKHNWNV